MRSPILLSLALPIYLFGMTDFELINHNDKSVTGNGVYVGVIDGAINKDHPNLTDKVEEQIYSKYNNQTYTPDFSVDTHGSHVAGIIAANGNDGVEGIAKDAKIYGVQITGHNVSSSTKFAYPDVYEYFKDKNVAAINNSWNSAVYPLSQLSSVTSSTSLFDDHNTPNEYLRLINNHHVARDLIKLSKEKNILSVFAAGNEGIISPGIMALAPYYDESLRSMLVVSALDSSQIVKNSDGLFEIKASDIVKYANGVTTYSNGLKGAYNFALVAPGSNVNNVNGAYNVPAWPKTDMNLFRTSSGTSQATPMVTAAAALVSQKYPFLNGKQIADVLLSTANKNYTLPKVIVKETDTGETFCDGMQKCPSKTQYTVFYIDHDIPKNADGSINIQQVEIDLMESEHWGNGWKYDRMENLEAIDDIHYPWVQKITKEDLMGQGILDVDKALKGLGILDANRLSDSDVRSDIIGSDEAYYSLNLGAYNAEFSNDISQRTWEANTHNPKADNLPTKLDNLNVGLIKTGSGILTLSGTNSYLGATVINEGQIKLKSTNGKGGEIAGSVYVNNGSTLSGNGIIKQNLTNDNSIVRPGNEDLSDLTVNGTYTQKGESSKLILDFGNQGNSKLKADSYDIKSGNLEYNPLKKYYTVNQEVRIELGDLANQLSNFTKVAVASNNSIEFNIELYADKTTINKNPNSNPTQPDTGDSNNQEQSSNTIPSIGEASTDSGTTSGGSLNGDSSSQNSGSLVENDNPSTDIGTNSSGTSENNSNLTDGAGSANNPNNQNQNTQNTNNPTPDSLIVTPVVRPDAYATSSAQLSQTMRNIRAKSNLNDNYKKFFTALDSSDSSSYKTTMKRIEGGSVSSLTSVQTSAHSNFSQNNMLFGLNPASSTLFAYNQNPYDNGVMVASIATDYAVDLGLYTAPKNYWYINPTYKRYNGDDFDGYQTGVSLNLAQYIDSDKILSYGIGISSSKLDFDIGAEAKSSNIDLALNYTQDFGNFKLLGGGSFMVSFNENDRVVDTNLNSEYNSYSGSLQLGVAKDYIHYSIVATPIAYIGYGKIYQESFKESGGLFAKNYDSINHDIFSGGVGLNLAYLGSDEGSRYTGYILYERMFHGYEMDSMAEFNDFKGEKFTQRYHLDKNRLNLGIGAEYALSNGYFAKIGVGGEFATTSDNFNLSATFGKRF